MQDRQSPPLGLMPAEYRPVAPGHSGAPFLASLGAHSLSILLLLGLGTASNALRPPGPVHRLFMELAARPEPTSSIAEPAPPVEAGPRSPLVVPQAALSVPTPEPLPEAPPLPPPGLPAPLKIDLPEEIPVVAKAAAPPAPEVQLGGFSKPVVEKAASAPAPSVMGAFGNTPSVTAKPARGQVAAAGFGDAPAVRGAQQRGGSVSGAGFGDVAAGKSGGLGRAAAVSAGGFGDVATRTAAAGSAQVQPAGFGNAAVSGTRKTASKETSEEDLQSALAILYKPRPAYTDEARQLKIEGEVWLEVSFAASGQARVLRVVRSLGHGLDESAVRSVEAIRFRPAVRRGEPVDSTAVVRISFELAY